MLLAIWPGSWGELNAHCSPNDTSGESHSALSRHTRHTKQHTRHRPLAMRVLWCVLIHSRVAHLVHSRRSLAWFAAGGPE